MDYFKIMPVLFIAHYECLICKKIIFHKLLNEFLCRRQFDNVKRIFKMVEDLQGSVIMNIKFHFLLSEDLAK